jgi:endonuclease/exonuclease/phosphatase family metal-dependent hydrolase
VFNKIVLIFNVFIAFALILVHYSAQVNPLSFWPVAFLGLAYPIILIMNVLFLIYWIWGKDKKYILISLIAMLVSWDSNKVIFQLSSKAQTANEISIMTWNVKNFDYYNWSGNENARSEMFALIKEHRPEILCLQEFYTEDKGKFKNLKELKKELNYEYQYFAKTYSIDNNRHWGLVMFSDYEIINTGKLVFTEGTRLNTCMYMDIELEGNQNTRIYNVHLQSNQFSSEDYKFLSALEDDESNSSAKKIIQKLKKGYINRALQAKQVLESRLESPYPSIICGDFNDTPISYAYQTISEDMQDAFVQKGVGFGKTFDNPSPFLRIDYALFHPFFSINDYESISNELSDHYPIVVKFGY